MPAQIRRISQKYLRDAAEILVKKKTLTAANTRQRYLLVAQSQKMAALTRILEVENFDAMIVFARTKQATEDLAERLRSRGLSVAALNGDLVQAQRERTIAQLKSGALDIVVATDVAARGLDVDRISHVVNFDIPQDAESYVHRIGRTGRAGRSGEALLFVTPRERQMLAGIERATRQPITEMPLPSVEDVNAQRVAKFTDAITAALESSDVEVFRGLISDYEREHDVPAIDIAAALATMSQEGSGFLLADEPARDERPRDERTRPDRGRGELRGERGDQRGERSKARVAGQRRHHSDVPMAKYRISVGRRHKVQPGAIVGALANEGGLTRADFGHIDIQGDHTLIDLPAELPSATVAALKRTRISGQLINLTKDAGAVTPRRFAGGTAPRKPGRRVTGSARKSHPSW
jgi:ATP-dependent RNA helicase DeaD